MLFNLSFKLSLLKSILINKFIFNPKLYLFNHPPLRRYSIYKVRLTDLIAARYKKKMTSSIKRIPQNRQSLGLNAWINIEERLEKGNMYL